MTTRHADVVADLPADAPGVSRFVLTCEAGRDVVVDATELVRRWGHDRAVPAPAIDRMCELTAAALAHGAVLRPRSVTACLRWADPDRARVDVRWHAGDDELGTATLVVDTAADGRDGRTPAAWLVLDGSANDVGPVDPPQRT